MSGSQNQHYVPKFILRQFLVDEAKEQVSVYDKQRDKGFVTSIKNIMAEHRFNDFVFEDWVVSFEPVACGIENVILPVYRRILETRRLDGTPQERADLGFLMAFQFLRSKAFRERYRSLEVMIRQRIEAMGHRMEDIEGWEPLTEDTLKQQDLAGLRESLPKFATIIAHKEFRLAEAAPGRSFYLGDNPVCLHNSRTFGPYGNLGLAVPGIEIYLPLSSDLMLCAWCPTVVEELRNNLKRDTDALKAEALKLALAGRMPVKEMQVCKEAFRPFQEQIDELSRACDTGVPISSTVENMDFYNSLQCGDAYRHVVCQQSDFALAKRHNKEFPQLRSGRQFSS